MNKNVEKVAALSKGGVAVLKKRRAKKKLAKSNAEKKKLTHFPIVLQEVEKVYTQTLAAGYRTLAVTSSTKGEGVTLMIKTLALRNMLAGRRTLLLDLNLDRPKIGALCGQTSVGYYQGFGLGVLSFKPDDHLLLKLREPGELKKRMIKWLEVYDSIIIDTSPLDTVSFNCYPSEVACENAEAAIMVVLASRTTQALAVEAVEKLKENDVNLVGTVLNDYYNPGLKDELIRKFRWVAKVVPPLSRWLENKIRYSRFLSLEI